MDIAVIGATGKVGRRVATQAARQGASVRAASRHPEQTAEGIRGVRFDWTDSATWEVARGADAMFVVGPFANPDPGRILGEFLASSDVPRVVLLSSLATEPGDGSPNGAMEASVVASGKEWTILRASWFMQNLSENPAFTRVLADRGEIPAAVGDTAISLVDTRDIAGMAAAVLTEEGHEERSYRVTGPRALTLTDAAEELSRGVGRRITYENRSPDGVAEVLTEVGVPESLVEVLGFVDSVTRTGTFTAVSEDVLTVMGRPAGTFADFATSLGVKNRVWRRRAGGYVSRSPAGAGPAESEGGRASRATSPVLGAGADHNRGDEPHPRTRMRFRIRGKGSSPRLRIRAHARRRGSQRAHNRRSSEVI